MRHHAGRETRSQRVQQVLDRVRSLGGDRTEAASTKFRIVLDCPYCPIDAEVEVDTVDDSTGTVAMHRCRSVHIPTEGQVLQSGRACVITRPDPPVGVKGSAAPYRHIATERANRRHRRPFADCAGDTLDIARDIPR